MVRPLTMTCVVLLAGCQGSILGSRSATADAADGGDPTVPTLKACTTRGQGSAPQMRLLWQAAYLTELTRTLGAGAATAAASVALSPATSKAFAFETAGSLVTDATLESLANSADAVASWALSSDSVAQSVFGCNARAATGSAAEACFVAFVKAKGERLLRRPIAQAELDDTLGFFRAEALLGEADGVKEGFRQGLASLLLHPDFLYLRDAPVGQTSALDPFSLAARVSFALTGHGPDEPLVAAARDGSLAQAAVLEREVKRLQQLPEARDRTLAFFRQWLAYDRGSVAYSSAFLEGLSTTNVQPDSVKELDAFVTQLTWTAPASPSALLTSAATAPLPASLAAIYGVAPGVTTLPANRAGVLTRVGMLATGADDWHVVARGVSVLQKFLCRDIAPPPFSVAAAQQQAESLKVSNLDRLTTVTASAACSGCHRQINPLGGVRSDFDAIGRAVSLEKHYAGGQFDYQVPAVTSADLSPAFGRPATVDGSVALSAVLAASPEFASCFAQQYVHSVMGRAELSDQCLADDGAKVVVAGGTILDTMRAVLTSPELTIWKE
jgi:Protein of unknown function (DUF1592)/Protein of unknown function (DUF1588)/Protein of unknown function (DUF1595)